MSQFSNPAALLRRIGLVLALVVGLAAGLSAQITLVRTYGGFLNQRMGTSIASIGDLDGDGVPEIVVTGEAPSGFSSPVGRYFVVSGATGAFYVQKFSGNSNDGFGNGVIGLGDVNGDGFDDYAVSAPDADNPNSNCGRVRVYSGLDQSVIWVYVGANSNARIGVGLARVGDVDGDGVRDFAFSSPNTGGNAVVFVYSGFDGSLIHLIQAPSQAYSFGLAIADAGDLDGDGLDDVAVGAPTAYSPNVGTRGAVFVFSGADTSILMQSYGPYYNTRFGSTMVRIGDRDGDGVEDLAVGAPDGWSAANTANFGQVLYVSGADGSIIRVIYGRLYRDHFGSTLARISDLDGDGVDDLLVAAYNAHRVPNSATGSGEVAIHSGANGTRLAVVAAGSSGAYFGSALAAVGDLDGDGLEDFAVGAPQDDLAAPGNANDGGSYRIYLTSDLSIQSVGGGQANGPLARFEVNGRDTGTRAGPFVTPVWLGDHFSLDFEGSPNSFYEVYGSSILNPGGQDYGAFGSFDIGTGPSFADVYVALPGFTSIFPLYLLDASGRASVSYYLPSNWAVGPLGHLQALVQNPQPWVNGVWGTLSAAQTLVAY